MRQAIEERLARAEKLLSQEKARTDVGGHSPREQAKLVAVIGELRALLVESLALETLSTKSPMVAVDGLVAGVLTGYSVDAEASNGLVSLTLLTKVRWDVIDARTKQITARYVARGQIAPTTSPRPRDTGLDVNSEAHAYSENDKKI
jgi:hypothetical protein